KHRMAKFWEFGSGALTLKDLTKPLPMDDGLPPELTALAGPQKAGEAKGGALIQDSYPSRASLYNASILMGYAQPGPAYHVLNNREILSARSQIGRAACGGRV